MAVRTGVRKAVEFEAADRASCHKNSGLIEGIIEAQCLIIEAFCPDIGGVLPQFWGMVLGESSLRCAVESRSSVV